MIVKSTWRRAGGLETHLLRSDTNEIVQVRTDLFRGTDDLHAALQLMEALARSNPRVKRSFVHVVVSPDHDMSEVEITQALSMVEEEHRISPEAPRAVVAHLKGERAIHLHAVYPVVDPATGKAVPSHNGYERDELISRRLEHHFGERVTPGPRIERNVAELRRRGLHAEADRLAPHVPVRHEDPLSRTDRQQASRLGIDVQEWSAHGFALFEATGRDLDAFAGRLRAAGLSVARGSKTLVEEDGVTERDDKVVLLVDDATGYGTSLVRLLRREAKAAGRPLKITEWEVGAAFPHVQPFKATRDAGLEHARTRAEHDLSAERRNATMEAALDGDAGEILKLQKSARKAREDEERRTREAAWATLRARREAIQALYRERDAMRRRRVDRAFRAAGLLDVPELRRLAFALAAAGVLMTGGSLALALAAGVVAAEFLPTRARARATAAAASRERADDAMRRRSETDTAYRDAKAVAAAARANSVRFTFDQVPKADRVLAGLYAGAVLRGGPLSPEASSARDALGPEVVAGLTRMVERGSPLQVRRLLHFHRGIALDRRDPAVKAALARHAAALGRPATDRPKRDAVRRQAGQGRTRPNKDGGIDI